MSQNLKGLQKNSITSNSKKSLKIKFHQIIITLSSPQERSRTKKRILLLALLLSVKLAGCFAGPSPGDIRRARTFYNIGVNRAQNGKYREALAFLKRAENLNPKDYWIQEAIGGVYLALRQPKLALKHYRKALQIEPKSPRGWNNLGTVFLELKEWEKAISAFKTALNNLLYQTPCNAQINLAWAYHKAGKKNSSKKAFREAVKICPKFCQAHRLHGLAAYKWKEYKLSESSFLKLTQLCPDFAPGYYWLAKVRIAQKKYRRALPAIYRCLELAKKFEPVKKPCSKLLSTARTKLANF